MNKSDGFVIETVRMTLRRFTMDDVDLLYELNSDPLVLRYLSRTVPTRHDVQEDIQGYMEKYASESTPGRLAAFDREHGHFIGRFSLHWYRGSSELSVGYRLKPVWWGVGLATEGLESLIDYGFGMPVVERIRAQTMFVNAGSRRVMKKCGMRHIRTFHEQYDDPIPGTEQGEVEYAIARGDWLAGSVYKH